MALSLDILKCSNPQSGLITSEPSFVTVMGGDSIWADHVVSGKLQQLSETFGSGPFYNTAVGGRVAQDIIDNYTTEVHPHAPSGGSIAWYMVLIGSNDLAGSMPAATLYAKLKTIWALARADGFKVLACTIINRANWSTGFFSTNWPAVNALILSDPSLYDAIARPELVLPDPTSILYFSDGTHPTHYGGLQVAIHISGLLDIRKRKTFEDNFSRLMLSRFTSVDLGTALCAKSGGGDYQAALNTLYHYCGTTSGDFALARLIRWVGALPGFGPGTDYGMTIRIGWREVRGDHPTNMTTIIRLGPYAGNTPSALTDTGMQLEQNVNGVRVSVHDGTTLTSSSYFTGAINISAARDWILEHRPGKITLYYSSGGGDPVEVLSMASGLVGFATGGADELTAFTTATGTAPYGLELRYQNLNVMVNR